jgi:tetratricopeptide (TPR) repeat protein
LASFQSNQQLFLDATKSFEEGLTILTKNPEKDKFLLAETLFGFASLQKNMQQFKDAEENFKKALIIYKELRKLDSEKYNIAVAFTISNIADMDFFQQNVSEAISNYEEAISLFRNLQNANPEYIDPFLSWSLNNLAWLTYKTDLQHAITCGQEAIDLIEKYPTNPVLIQGLALCQLRMARYQILNKNFVVSEEFARKAFLNNSSNMCKKNLAHALLFQGKYEEAQSLYSEIALDNQVRILCLSDFDEFEMFGISHPDMDKIRKLLKE